jgi:hypothetical protein
MVSAISCKGLSGASGAEDAAGVGGGGCPGRWCRVSDEVNAYTDICIKPTYYMLKFLLNPEMPIKPILNLYIPIDQRIYGLVLRPHGGTSGYRVVQDTAHA